MGSRKAGPGLGLAHPYIPSFLHHILHPKKSADLSPAHTPTPQRDPHFHSTLQITRWGPKEGGVFNSQRLGSLSRYNPACHTPICLSFIFPKWVEGSQKAERGIKSGGSQWEPMEQRPGLAWALDAESSPPSPFPHPAQPSRVDIPGLT